MHLNVCIKSIRMLPATTPVPQAKQQDSQYNVVIDKEDVLTKVCWGQGFLFVLSSGWQSWASPAAKTWSTLLLVPAPTTALGQVHPQGTLQACAGFHSLPVCCLSPCTDRRPAQEAGPVALRAVRRWHAPAQLPCTVPVTIEQMQGHGAGRHKK